MKNYYRWNVTNKDISNILFIMRNDLYMFQSGFNYSDFDLVYGGPGTILVIYNNTKLTEDIINQLVKICERY